MTTDIIHNVFRQGPASVPEWFSWLPRMETPRLVLRKLTMRDATDLYRYAQDP